MTTRTFVRSPEDIARIILDLETRLSSTHPPNPSNPQYHRVIEEYAEELVRKGASPSIVSGMIGRYLYNHSYHTISPDPNPELNMDDEVMLWHLGHKLK